MNHLNSPLKESTWFPTLETYIENHCNKPWRKSTRSVHMSLGISPILFVITQPWVLKKQQILNPDLTYKWYADDGSFYFNTSGLTTLLKSHLNWQTIKDLMKGQNLLVSLLNNLSLFQEAGLKLCSQKSRWIRLFGIWLHPFQSLGLRLYCPKVKWRQLGVPNKSWRLYLHMLNMFITYIYARGIPYIQYFNIKFSDL